jgi:thiamine-monophosphate kinase
MATVGQVGELALIDRLRRLLPTRGDILVGAGDDCAVVRPDPQSVEDWVLKSDPVICGRHFLPDADPRAVGHKAMGRVLSDLAAMGAEPRWALVNLVLTREIPVATVDAVYEGMLTLAHRHRLALVGGDTSQGSELALHVFACGTVPHGTARLRSGARVGDGLYVTGALGGSLAGRHLTFEPRVSEGLWLRAWAGAMIDISDSLSSELWHIAEQSGVALEVEAACIPVTDAAARTGKPLDAALYDGEDFELLFSVPSPRQPAFAAAWRDAFPSLPCTRIGAVTGGAAGGAVRLCADGSVATLPRRGYEHLTA